MRHPLKLGLSFGMTSGIITTLGLMMGLYSGTHSQLVVIGGIVVIAVADALSDAFGVHISEESEKKHTTRQVWESTLYTFLFKFLFAMTFVVPILLMPLAAAVEVSVAWGLLLLAILSHYIADERKQSKAKTIGEHLLIAIAVLAISYLIGSWVPTIFS